MDLGTFLAPLGAVVGAFIGAYLRYESHVSNWRYSDSGAYCWGMVNRQHFSLVYWELFATSIVGLLENYGGIIQWSGGAVHNHIDYYNLCILCIRVQTSSQEASDNESSSRNYNAVRRNCAF